MGSSYAEPHGIDTHMMVQGRQCERVSSFSNVISLPKEETRAHSVMQSFQRGFIARQFRRHQ